jgi:hypothetical protein
VPGWRKALADGARRAHGLRTQRLSICRWSIGPLRARSAAAFRHSCARVLLNAMGRNIGRRRGRRIAGVSRELFGEFGGFGVALAAQQGRLAHGALDDPRHAAVGQTLRADGGRRPIAIGRTSSPHWREPSPAPRRYGSRTPSARFATLRLARWSVNAPSSTVTTTTSRPQAHARLRPGSRRPRNGSPGLARSPTPSRGGDNEATAARIIDINTS